jgi:hypothetical protein
MTLQTLRVIKFHTAHPQLATFLKTVHIITEAYP